MHHAEIDPVTKMGVWAASDLRDGVKQRLLIQIFKPENWLTIREAGEALREIWLPCRFPIRG